jgi:hypothetical protein
MCDRGYILSVRRFLGESFRNIFSEIKEIAGLQLLRIPLPFLAVSMKPRVPLSTSGLRALLVFRY